MLSTAASVDDVRRILGYITESQCFDILELNPTLGDVQQAASWVCGDGDILAKNEYPQSGVIAQILDILATDEG
jgi:hypothetical protein